jgi:hypothetical protein
MPTPVQIDAAEALLTPATTGNLTTKAQADLLTFLRKYLYDHKKGGGYTLIAEKLAAATGRQAAQLQAVLTNVSGVGSKVASMTGEIAYSTQANIDNELEFALFVMYQPINAATMGGMPSEVASAIRAEFARTGCLGDEYQRTRCKDLS